MCIMFSTLASFLFSSKKIIFDFVYQAKLNSMQFNRITSYLVSFFLIFSSAFSQKIVWQKRFGGSGYDNAYSGYLSENGFVVLAGTNRSSDALVSKNYGNADAWVISTNSKGKLLWKNAFGGSKNDEIKSVKPTADDGYILTGWSESSDNDIEKNQGKSDFLIIKINAAGQKEWIKTYGGSHNDRANDAVELDDGTIVVVGETGSKDGDVQKNSGGLDMWVIALDKNGEFLWQKVLGGREKDGAMQIEKTQDGFVVVGSTDSPDGDIYDFKGKKDVWVIKFNKNNDILWKKTYGGSHIEEAYDLLITPENDILISGTTFSTDGIIEKAHGGGDFWLLKLTDFGEIAWQKTYGGSSMEGANSVSLTQDSCILIAGTSISKNGDLTSNKGMYDAWALKVDSSGKIIWQKSFGGEGNDAFYKFVELPNSDYLGIGTAGSDDGDYSGIKSYGGYDFWLATFRDPENTDTSDFQNPTVVFGKVTDAESGSALSAEISLIDLETKQELQKINSDKKTGTFNIILPKEKKYFNIGFYLKNYLFQDTVIVLSQEDISTQIFLNAKLQPVKAGAKITLHNIHFDIGKWSLTENSLTELELLVKFLKDHPKLRIEISGHTDNTGNKADKIKLSQYRANAVKDYLVKNGIPAELLYAKGYGMAKPVASNNTEEERAQNRRVEFKITHIYK